MTLAAFKHRLTARWSEERGAHPSSRRRVSAVVAATTRSIESSTSCGAATRAGGRLQRDRPAPRVGRRRIHGIRHHRTPRGRAATVRAHATDSRSGSAIRDLRVYERFAASTSTEAVA